MNKRPVTALERRPRPLRISGLVRKASGFEVSGASRALRKEDVDRARQAAIEAGDAPGRILIDVLWGTGCRLSEALALVVRDVHFSAPYFIEIPTLKTRKSAAPRRGVPVPIEIILPLSLYTRDRELGPDDRLFKWKRTQAWTHLKQHLRAAGVPDDRAFPHAFRHGHAIHAILGGVPLSVIQQTLGHSSIVTTQKYVRATGMDIAESYKRITWT